jgi:OOP family OmpA-OmpF porin
MKKITVAAIAITGLLGASPAFAGDQGWYLLGGVGQATGGDSGQSSVDNAVASAGGPGFSSSMDTPTLYKLQAGYQLDRNWAVEGGYIGSNNENYTAAGGNLPGLVSSSASVSGWNLAGVGILPLADKFSLLGKLGIAAMQESATAQGAGFYASTTGSKTDVTYGIGVKYDFTNAVFVRADLDSYNIGNSNYSSRSTVGMIDIGYQF